MFEVCRRGSKSCVDDQELLVLGNYERPDGILESRVGFLETVRVSGDTPGRSREPPGVFLETRAGFMETRAGFHNPGWVLRAPLRDPEGLENAEKLMRRLGR